MNKQSKSVKKTGFKNFYFPIVSKNPQNSVLPQDSKLIQSARKLQQSNKISNESPKMKRNLSELKTSKRKSQIKRNPQQLKMNNSALYFTKRVKQQNQKRSIQIKQKLDFLSKDLQSKRQQFQNFKLQKQKIKDQERSKILQDIYTKHSQRQREKYLERQKLESQRNFIHQCNMAKIHMERNLKVQTKQEQIILAKQKYVQTEHHSSFLRKEYLKGRNKHMKLLESRLVFLLSEKIPKKNEQSFLKSKMTSRSFYGELPKDQ